MPEPMISVTSCYSQRIATFVKNHVGPYARVIGLKESDLDSFFLEVSFGLGQVQRGVVRRGVPVTRQFRSSGASTTVSVFYTSW